MSRFAEYNFDGIVGPTHHYGGLSLGNLASSAHSGKPSNPQAAALEGLEKMRLVLQLGAPQAVLPPVARPLSGALGALGYRGAWGDCLAQARHDSPALLSRLFSASSMWAANAATVVPSCDADDKRLHLLVANLSSMPHRSLEPPDTERILRSIFARPEYFVVHPRLPTYLGDEGAANHLRLQTSQASMHVFAWGKSFDRRPQNTRFDARQSLEASQAARRLCALGPEKALFWQQLPAGIDAGAFHSDVLAVSNAEVLLLHEAAFVDPQALLARLERALGPEFRYCLASEGELTSADAVASYPFNSQLLSLKQGGMALLAPAEAKELASARAFLERAASEIPEISAIHFVHINGSMDNGGGPACLRLRVLLSEAERRAISARVFLDDELYRELRAWVLTHYRTELELDDLADPSLVDEVRVALDELTQILRLGSIYPFQGGNDEP